MRHNLNLEIQAMLKTIADSVEAPSEEMLNALVWAAYYKPHGEWNAILQDFRNREANTNRAD